MYTYIYIPGWWFGTWIFFFHIHWECHHPNWRTPSCFRGVEVNHHPEMYPKNNQRSLEEDEVAALRSEVRARINGQLVPKRGGCWWMIAPVYWPNGYVDYIYILIYIYSQIWELFLHSTFSWFGSFSEMDSLPRKKGPMRTTSQRSRNGSWPNPWLISCRGAILPMIWWYLGWEWDSQFMD